MPQQPHPPQKNQNTEDERKPQPPSRGIGLGEEGRSGVMLPHEPGLEEDDSDNDGTQ